VWHRVLLTETVGILLTWILTVNLRTLNLTAIPGPHNIFPGAIYISSEIHILYNRLYNRILFISCFCWFGLVAHGVSAPAMERKPGSHPACHFVFTARRSYASAVLGVVILSVCPSVCPSHARFVTNPKNLPAIFYTTWKGSPSSQMWFFVQLCSSWQDLNWLKASRGPSAIAELPVIT